MLPAGLNQEQCEFASCQTQSIHKFLVLSHPWFFVADQAAFPSSHCPSHVPVHATHDQGCAQGRVQMQGSPSLLMNKCFVGKSSHGLQCQFLAGSDSSWFNRSQVVPSFQVSPSQSLIISLPVVNFDFAW